MLDEDTYTDALSHIIARDFFPGLLETQTQQDFLDAIESRDSGWIAEAGRRLTEAMTPGPEGRRLRGRRGTSITPLAGRAGNTPRGWTGATPLSVAGSAVSTTSTSPRPEVDLNMSLTNFQAKYTSEDNESFNTLLDKQNTKRAKKYAWLHNSNKIPSARQIAHRTREAKLLEASKNTDKRLILSQNLDDRKAMVDVRPSAPRNAFMFTPDSIEDTHPTTAQAAADASNMGPKAVVHSNTRLPAPALEGSDDAVPPSPSVSAIDAAIAGRPRPSASDPGYDGSATPRVNGYAFVDAEPTPSELGEPREEPPDTAALLARLGAGGAGPNPFNIREASRREGLHLRMVERTAKSKRAGALDAADAPGSMPTPRFAVGTPFVRGTGAPAAWRGGLTPAAQRLLGRIGTPVRRDRMGGAFGGGVGRSREGAVGQRWTPTPKIRRAKDPMLDS